MRPTLERRIGHKVRTVITNFREGIGELIKKMNMEYELVFKEL